LNGSNEIVGKGAVFTPGSGVTARVRAGLRMGWPTSLFWILGSAVVIVAQPGLDRKAAGLVSAVAGMAAIVLVRVLTPDPARRYLRSLIATIIAVPVAAVWVIRALLANGRTDAGIGFYIDGLEKRITLPLMFVLLAPLVLRAIPEDLRRPRALWKERASLWGRTALMDRIFLAYCAVAVPAFLLGLAHRAPHSYFGQDLGLVVFFVFMYAAGRAAIATAALDWAEELVDILLLLAVTHFALLGWETSPIYNYIEAACAGAVAFALFRPSRSRLLSLGVAVAILVGEAIAVYEGTDSTVTIEVLGALGIIGYLLVRRRDLVPQWLIVAAAVIALASFVAFTGDGRTLRGQYHGPDVSNVGRTYEAERVRARVRHSPVSLVFGRGFGSTVDLRGGPRVYTQTLVTSGRDLAHVPEVHLLAYSFLLKEGLLGVLWLLAFAVGVVVLGVRALERSARTRDPSLVVYAALAMLGLVAALAAASHLPANPLDGLSIGLLVTCLGATRPASAAGSGTT
jgi:hypothetical protein